MRRFVEQWLLFSIHAGSTPLQIREMSGIAMRWGKGVKTIAIGWLILLFSAWLHGEITVGFIYGAMASGVLWTAGSFLQSTACRVRRYTDD